MFEMTPDLEAIGTRHWGTSAKLERERREGEIEEERESQGRLLLIKLPNFPSLIFSLSLPQHFQYTRHSLANHYNGSIYGLC